MDVATTRWNSVVEWCLAAAFLLATLLVGSLIVRELRVVSATEAVRADPLTPARTPSGVPPRAISVPVLLLMDGHEIHIGATVQEVAELLGRDAEVGTIHVDRGALGDRLTRVYEHGETRFVLVFEPFEAQGPPRVVAIYLL
jgi:hypothetical protein